MSAKTLPPAQALPSEHPAILKLEHAAERDELTGFATQQHFTRSLERLIRQRSQAQLPLTLVLLQLANYYEISSWVGGSEARLLLVRLARLLRDCVPDGTWLCRCQCHEFAMLLIGADSHQVTELASRIDQTLQRHAAQLVPPQLSLACGFGSIRIDNQTPDSAVAFAGARHAIWQHQLTAAGDLPVVDDDQSAEHAARVRMALAEDRLLLSFQGTFGFRVDSVPRYEARVRLADEGHCLPARLFMAAAVKNALGEELDRWVIARAIAVLDQDRPAGCQLTVNLSQNTLVSPGFPDWLASMLPADLADRLVLQVSELDILTTQHYLARFCQRVRELKVALAINHFGAVEDPFRYLSLFHADQVRLHRSWLQQLTDSGERQQRLAALSGQLHHAGIQILAPGIENFSDLPLLWGAGVDFVQGHSLHRPSMKRDCEFVEEVELNLDC